MFRLQLLDSDEGLWFGFDYRKEGREGRRKRGRGQSEQERWTERVRRREGGESGGREVGIGAGEGHVHACPYAKYRYMSTCRVYVHMRAKGPTMASLSPSPKDFHAPPMKAPSPKWSQVGPNIAPLVSNYSSWGRESLSGPFNYAKQWPTTSKNEPKGHSLTYF